MLQIQVLGKGMIPRGLGLAPRKEPFPADLTLISTILRTPGLQVNMISPEGRAIPVKTNNIKKLYEKYDGKTSYNTKPIETDDTKPSFPETPKPVIGDEESKPDLIQDPPSVPIDPNVKSVSKSDEIITDHTKNEEPKQEENPAQEPVEETKEEMKPENDNKTNVPSQFNKKDNVKNHKK